VGLLVKGLLYRLLLRVAAAHEYELVLPHGHRERAWLAVRDTLALTSEGEPEPCIVIERLSASHTRITIRSDDDMLTSDDLELLREARPVPA
jgi:hypothetical protein